MQTQKIFKVIEEKINDSGERIFDNEAYYSKESSEVEHKSRDGFIPFTDGGWEVEAWSRTTDEGLVIQTKGIEKALENNLNTYYELAKEDLEREFGKDIDMENLTADQESYYYECVDDRRWDDNTIYNSIQCYYYNPFNPRSVEERKHSIVVSGSVNLEAPYHRQGNMEDFIEFKFVFESLEQLADQLDKAVEQIEIWFAGKMYNEFPERELTCKNI